MIAELDSDLLAEAVAHRILKSSRQLAKLAEQVARHLIEGDDSTWKKAVEFAIRERVAAEFTEACTKKQYGIETPQTSIDRQVRLLADNMYRDMKVTIKGMIEDTVQSTVKEELAKRLPTMSNDELLRLIGR